MPASRQPRTQPVEWRDDALRIAGQTLLPRGERDLETLDYPDVCGAVRQLAVRGAPIPARSLKAVAQ